MRTLIIGLSIAIAASCALPAHAEALPNIKAMKSASPTEYRDAQFLTCIAGVPEARFVKDSEKVIESCLTKAETKTTKWQERKAKAALKAKEKEAAKVAKAMTKCKSDSECQAADGKEI